MPSGQAFFHGGACRNAKFVLSYAYFIKWEVCAMRHAGTQTLETDRLFLRQLLPEDAEQMYTNWASDPEVTRFLRWEPHKTRWRP